MATYSQMKLAMQEALQISSQARKRMEQGVTSIRQAQFDVDSIASRWGADIQDLMARAQAEPENAAIQLFAAEVQEMLKDHAQLKSEIDALVAAIGS